MPDMQFSKHPVVKWLPALLMMVAIFVFSATPSKDTQHNVLQYIFNKSGHVIGYTMLTLSFLRAFEFSKRHSWLAWLLALLYAVSDEYHQSFVPGRHPASFDVLVYDHAGALIAVWIRNHLAKQKQPVHDGLVVEPEVVTS
jgi:VanZ family protein